MEIIAVAAQTVAENQNVLFTDTVTNGNCSITHRTGSGLVNLRGTTAQCRARYKVSFGGNIAVPTGGTAGAISLALTIDGEPVAASIMTVTPIDVNEFNNVFGALFIDVPKNITKHKATATSFLKRLAFICKKAKASKDVYISNNEKRFRFVTKIEIFFIIFLFFSFF